MTVIVGVKCSDGVVVGADSVATSSAGHMHVMRMQYPNKIETVGGRVIVACSGPVGLAHRFQEQVKGAHDRREFQNACIQCSTGIPGTTCADILRSGTPRTMQTGFGLGAIVAAPFGNVPELVEFGMIDFQPEIKKEPLHFVSMGSG